MFSKSYMSKYMKLIFFILLFSTYFLYSQEKSILNKKFSIYPDEYSVLDDIRTPIYTNDDYVLEVLQSARVSYIKALVKANKKDTLQAVKYFKLSLDYINSLASYPDISSNPDFTDLAIQIMENYESFMKRSDLIDENSPLFVIKDKLFNDADKEIVFKDLETLKDKKLKEKKAAASTGIVEPKIPLTFTIPMPENEIVKKSIKWFTETSFGRKVFQSWYSKHTRWFPLMKKIAIEEGIPQEIVYLSMIESGLDPNAVSKASAVGLWQFMYETGQDFNLNSDASIWVDERKDPIKSTRAAMKYLKYLYNEFGDWHLAIASYNCGQGRVRRAIRKSGLSNPTFWDIDELLPKETRYYVPRYISTVLVASEPSLYNFQTDTFKFHQEYKFEEFELSEPVSISAIAKCLNASDSLVYALNPELARSSTPPNMDSYKLKIPVGSKSSFAEAFSNLTQDEKQPYVEHKVLRGENLAMIAKKYGIDKDELVALNDLKSKNSRLKRGSKLILPITATQYEEINEFAKETGEYSPSENSVDVVHYVKRGESLFRIARKYGVSVDYLVDLNNLKSKNSRLNVGQKLVVSLKSDDESDEESSDVATVEEKEIPKLDAPIIVNHRVKPGESLSDIAQLYNTDIETIKTANRLRSNTLKSGRHLRVQTLVHPEEFKSKSELKTLNQIAFHYVKRGETVGKIAARYGMSASDLSEINNIKRGRIYPGQKLKIQKEFNSRDNDNVEIASNSEQSRKEIKANAVHKVRKGESLFQISQKYNLSVDQVKALNNLSSDYIYVGQNLKVTSAGGESSNIASSRSTNTTHTVRRGETLGQIAENYGVSVSQLRNWNGIRGSKIYPGKKLKLQSNTNYAQSSTPKHLEYHRVRKGETLGQIADKYDVSVSQLQAWNNISGTNIKAGDKLALSSENISKGSNSKSSGGEPVTYVLRSGETLSIVARKFSMPLNTLIKLNPNLNPNNLQIGQKIRIK